MEDSKWIPLFLTFSFLLVSFILWHLLLGKGSILSRLPFGNTRTLLCSLLFVRGSFQEVSSIVHRLRVRYGPVMTLGFGSMSTIWVTDRDIVHNALVKEGGIFSDRLPASEGGAFDIIITSKGHVISLARGKLWGVLRRNILSKVLHTSNLRAFAGGRRRALDKLVEDLQAQPQDFVFTAIFSRVLFQLIVSVCFGEDLDVKVMFELEGIRRDNAPLLVKRNIFEIMPSITKLVFRRTWSRVLEVRRKQDGIIIPLIRARRRRVAKELSQQCQDDTTICYLDTLLDLEIPDQEEGRTRKLREDEIVSLCNEFVLLGAETTASTLEWIMANLIVHPHTQHKLYEEIIGVSPPGQEIRQDDLAKMPYLKAVILETLRLHPPITIPFPRMAPREARIDGHTVEKGQMIIFDLTNIGRDESIWENPSEFKPERFLEGGDGEGVDITGSREIKMVPFGVGRRLCPGLGLAMLNLEYFLANLVREFRWEAARNGRQIDLTAMKHIIGAMKNPLRVRISPR